MTFRSARLWCGAADCSLALQVHLETAGGRWVGIDARLRYHRADPYAVYFDTHLELDEPVTWMFSRDILDDGLIRSGGEGDVTVRRCGDPWALEIVLAGDGGPVVLQAPVTSVAGFLEATWEQVPPGSERDHLDLDRLLRALLDGGGPSGDSGRAP
ncbi:SsgA family sporulation/cell division regulator [Kitasatospora sp. NPDC096147]|uniref:SsgA family sporulation/cell division regulator n=1 Tax=Kitasatospora sp. NPDC096147 TaxID=3364093 RepID=UPI003818E1DF